MARRHLVWIWQTGFENTVSNRIDEVDELRRKAEQSEAVLRSIGDGVYVLDAEGLLVSMNREAERLLGWTAEELHGRSMHDAIHFRNAAGQQIAGADCQLMGVLESGKSIRIDSDVFIRKSGEMLPVAYHSSPILRDGAVAGAVLVFRDISGNLAREKMRSEALETEKLAREAAQENERQYHALADFIPQQVWTARPDGALDYVNQQALAFFGRTFDEMIGWGWKDVIHTDDLANCVERWTRSLSTGDDYEVHFRLLRSDGDHRWHLGRAIAVRDASAVIVRWLGTNTDIDAEFRARDREKILARISVLLGSSLQYEETLDKVAAASVPGFADGVVVHLFDEQGGLTVRSIHHRDPTMLDVLRSITRDYPANEQEPFGPMHVTRTGQPEMIAELGPEALSSYAHDEAHLRRIEQLAVRSFISVPLHSLDRALGSMTFFVMRGRREFDADSLALATQIGERASLAIENSLLYRRAEDAARAKDQFLATLSHELRTPLTAMLGWARMMRMPDLDAETIAQAIDAIERSAVAQAELIEDVLDISRVTAGKLSLNLDDVDLGHVALEAIAVLRPSATLREVTLDFHAPAEPIIISADGNRLQQIIWNLLSNAIKFTPKDGCVDVDCRRDESHAVLTVTDNGRGISRELLPHIFEAFRQEDSSTTRATSGLGLGLAIVRKLVELHGGSIQVASEGLGRGSVFTLTLPVAREPEAEVQPVRAEPEVVKPGSSLDLPSLRGVDVLTVDDNPDTLAFIATLLARCGAEVRTANSVENALRSIGERRPDVLISDVAMPGRDGYSLIHESAVKLPQRIPAVVLTAFGTPSDREALLAAGFDRYLKKPFEPVELARAVADLASTSRRNAGDPAAS